jgi:hypothetical protein
MASANKELKEELLEAGKKLFDPPSSIEDLLRLLFVSLKEHYNRIEFK